MKKIQLFNSRQFLNISEQIAKALAQQHESERLDALSKIRLTVPIGYLGAMDPFSGEYKEDVLELYKALTLSNAYSADHAERTEALNNLRDDQQPIPYRLGDSGLVGDYLADYGWILRTLNVKCGDCALEYGPGEGQLLLSLARMGCEVYAIDIEQRFLDLIGRDARKSGVMVHTKRGVFGDGFEGKKFDRIYCFEAFHHCLDHVQALTRMRTNLNAEGYMLFAGEPILPLMSDDYTIVPYPWGLRLDGESLRSIIEFGWMELGFSLDYFAELLFRAGLTAEVKACPGTWRGNCIVAKPYDRFFPILSPVEVRVDGSRNGWHSPEPLHRWTDGEAYIPVAKHESFNAVSFNLTNYLPFTIQVVASIGARKVTLSMESGETKNMKISLKATDRMVRLFSEPTLIVENSSVTDLQSRMLGVAVKSIEFLMP